ncbi:PPE domain-containing protein [Nocardia sp. NPDC003482]
MHEVGGRAATPGTDPDYAPNCEVFDHLGYDEIYRGVAQLKPEVLTAGRQAWQRSATGVGEAVQQAHAEIRGAMADGWRGPGAAVAAAAMQSFEELGQHLSDVLAVVGQRLDQANDAAETLRAALSKPVAAQPDLEAALLDPKQATANTALQKTAENLRLDAVRVMHTVYEQTFLPTGSQVPAFHSGGLYPNTVVVEGPADPTAPGGGSADVMRPGAVVGGDAVVRPVAESVTPTAESVADGASAREGEVAEGVSAAAPTSPAAATAPAAAAVPNVATAPASVPASEPVTAPTVPASNTAAPHVVSPNGAPSASPAATAPISAPATRIAAADSEQQRKRDDRRDGNGTGGTDAIGGMGAGVVGGLASGAFAASGDTMRPAAATPMRPKVVRFDDEDDDEYYSDFDEPTYLEPGEPGGDLVGRMDPTTPPVLGEWAEE